MPKAKELWISLMAELAIPGTAWLSGWAELEGLYSSADRHYHGMTHINMMAESLARFHSGPNIPELIFAIIYHDAIYDTTRKDNEERSAELASSTLEKLGIEPAIRCACAELILCTRKHEPVPYEKSPELSKLSGFFLDLDLLILGTDAATYDKYSANIRREYAWVPEKDYIAGRTVVLKSFASRPCIFFSEQIRDLHESQARENLKREIAALSME